MIVSRKHPFERCGLASLSDLKTSELRDLFSFLEREQEIFLAQENKFRSAEYRWPRDPLHTWSRVWEYPYVYHHLKSRRGDFGTTLPLVIDLGSGVTFFPFSIARLGYQVICVDIDPICGKDLTKAVDCIAHEPGKVEFRLTDGITLPFSNYEADIIYCISVLEHISKFEQTISEMARVLRPKGTLLLTFDLDMRGDSEIGPEKYNILIENLRKYFNEYYQTETIHPADILTSVTGPYPCKVLKGSDLAWFLLKQLILKLLRGTKMAKNPPFYLAVQGMVLVKR